MGGASGGNAVAGDGSASELTTSSVGASTAQAVMVAAGERASSGWGTVSFSGRDMSRNGKEDSRMAWIVPAAGAARCMGTQNWPLRPVLISRPAQPRQADKRR
ncbi:hypothetical protein CATMQ487_05250 [Sphaerotilus microaerophilus]|uniref:Uncharacterized protein n=1 Tax=Sphaerotilus microaerophilus TaxID=2914710 RepID=A0ABM7YH92_9BURK|nr:hypothetical protein CATMQ487_05250 [Sphaerotilus sp. FB-5]